MEASSVHFHIFCVSPGCIGERYPWNPWGQLLSSAAHSFNQTTKEDFEEEGGRFFRKYLGSW